MRIHYSDFTDSGSEASSATLRLARTIRQFSQAKRPAYYSSSQPLTIASSACHTYRARLPALRYSFGSGDVNSVFTAPFFPTTRAISENIFSTGPIIA